MLKKPAIIYTAFTAPVMLSTFFVPTKASPILFSILSVSFLIALIVIGATKENRLGPITIPLLIFFILLEGCVIAMIALRGTIKESTWFWGFPAASAIQLYGMFFAPLILISLAYALTFDSFTLKDEDLRALEDFKKQHAGKDGGIK